MLANIAIQTDLHNTLASLKLCIYHAPYERIGLGGSIWLRALSVRIERHSAETLKVSNDRASSLPSYMMRKLCYIQHHLLSLRNKIMVRLPEKKLLLSFHFSTIVSISCLPTHVLGISKAINNTHHFQTMHIVRLVHPQLHPPLPLRDEQNHSMLNLKA